MYESAYISIYPVKNINSYLYIFDRKHTSNVSSVNLSENLRSVIPVLPLFLASRDLLER